MKTLRLLQVEDSSDDAELVMAELGMAGLTVQARRVETAGEMEQALESSTWDLVISDYNLPAFSTEAALDLLRTHDLDLPFIVVSGCVGDETAASLMRAGAHDFIVKGNLSRLVPVVERELREAKIRRERRQAKEQLEASQQLLQDITSALGEGILVQSKEGRLIFMNPEAERLLGWTELEFMGRDVHDTIHCQRSDGTPYLREECEIFHILPQGKAHRAEDDLFMRKDGTVFPVSYVATPLMEKGRMIAAVIAFQDISERKQAQEALRRSTEEVQDLYDNAPCGYHSVDENGIIRRINQTELRWLGYTEEEVIGKPITELFTPGSQRKFQESFPLFKERGYVYDLENEMVRKDGTVMNVLLSATALKDPDGRYLMSRTSLYDITELKQADQKWRESEARYRSLFSNMLDGFAYCQMIFDQGRPVDFMYLEVNDAFHRLTGLDDVEGKRIGELLPGIRDAHPELFEIYGRVALTGQPERFEFYMEPLREWFWVSVYSPEIGYFVAVFDSITQRKLAENELRDSRRQLRELSAFLQNVREEERTRIARELHDELGQALTALRIDLDWLDAKLPQKEARIGDKLALMREQVAKTVESVRRISQDLRPGVLDDLGLAAAIEWQAEQFQERTGVKCTLVMNREEFELDSPVATSVFRIVQEALTNVARYAEAKEVIITVSEEAYGIRLRVRDDGKGFDAAVKPGKKSYGLLGIRERVSMLGGAVDITSSPGAGTSILAWIPFEGTRGEQ